MSKDPEIQKCMEARGGMTLLQYYRGQAIASVSCGIIAEANHGTAPESLANAADDIAKAMIALDRPSERDKHLDNLLAVCRRLRDELGGAEWGSDEHGARILYEIIDAHYESLKNAIAAVEGGNR